MFGSSSKDSKGEKPDYFKGDTAENLERFLLQCETKFRLEKRAFLLDIDRIWYAGSQMKDDAYGWFKTYRLNIDREEAIRITGSFTRSPRHETWLHFKGELRNSYGSRRHRDEAVAKWTKLQHTGRIDSFLDELIRLRRITGYDGDIVKDKLRIDLNEELGRDWAKITRKPDNIDQQIDMVREMGHQIEDYEAKRKGKGTQENKSHGREQSGGSSSKFQRKGKPQEGKPNQKPEQGKKGKVKGEWRDRKVELEGISQDLLSERKKDGLCQKCGKPNHSWFECWTKKPVTSKVAGAKRKAASVTEPEEQGAAKKGKAKAASSSIQEQAVASAGRIIELDEDDDLDLAPEGGWRF